MNKKRPVNLDLMRLKYSPMAIASILHRISGILLFVLLPLMLCLLHCSLESESGFAAVGLMMSSPLYKLAVWAFGASLIYHILAGIRHMVMDMGFGDHLEAGRVTSLAVIGLAVLFSMILGMWIC